MFQLISIIATLRCHTVILLLCHSSRWLWLTSQKPVSAASACLLNFQSTVNSWTRLSFTFFGSIYCPSSLQDPFSIPPESQNFNHTQSRIYLRFILFFQVFSLLCLQRDRNGHLKHPAEPQLVPLRLISLSTQHFHHTSFATVFFFTTIHLAVEHFVPRLAPTLWLKARVELIFKLPQINGLLRCDWTIVDMFLLFLSTFFPVFGLHPLALTLYYLAVVHGFWFLIKLDFQHPLLPKYVPISRLKGVLCLKFTIIMPPTPILPPQPVSVTAPLCPPLPIPALASLKPDLPLSLNIFAPFVGMALTSMSFVTSGSQHSLVSLPSSVLTPLTLSLVPLPLLLQSSSIPDPYPLSVSSFALPYT